MRFAPGQQFDRFKIEEILGTGGMSETYRARDTNAGTDVVLKFPHAYMLGDQASFTRFQREIEIGLRLKHPNVQRVFETGRIDNGILPFLVMEYIDGQPLRQVLAEQAPLPVDRAIDYARQLAEALAYCHQQGVVHRDLKPENVLVTPDNRLKLMDFGIALLQGARRVTWGNLSSTVGTPDYMAPEQVRGQRGDERSDIYAIGTILYEMLAAEVPFHGDNALAVMSQHVNRDAPLVSALRPDVAPGLAAVVQRALRRNPASRYQTMNDLIHDLDHLDEVQPIELTEEEKGVSGLPSLVKSLILIALTFLGFALLGLLAQVLHHAQAVH